MRQMGPGRKEGGWKDASYLLSLNVDVANKPAVKPLHLTKESKSGAGDSYIHQVMHWVLLHSITTFELLLFRF